MASRLELHTKLEELLGSKNVYSKSGIDKRSADDMSYLTTKCYELTVIDKHPDNEVINKLLNLSLCKWSTHFISDGLNHDVLTLYY